jgi:hypothetical protein
MQLWGKEWTRKHIKAMVAVSGPWGGSVNALKGPISGDNFGLYFSHSLLHRVQGTAPSGPWLFPRPEIFSERNVIVGTHTTNYTAETLEQLLQVVCDIKQ